MKSRIISAVIMTAIGIPVLYFGGYALDIAICILASLAFKEMLDIRKKMRIPNIMKIIAYLSMIMITLSNVGKYSLMFGLSYQTLSLVFLLILAPTIFLTKYKYTVNDAFYLASITIFIGIAFNLILMLYNESVLYLLYAMIVSIATEIFALFAGILIGKRTFTKISPNKTIEGCIVGSLVGVIISTTFYVTFINDSNIVGTIVLSLILSIIGQIGDLFFSLIKRENGVKDFSNLIPGHGGILDRLDSIIFIIIAYVFIGQII